MSPWWQIRRRSPRVPLGVLDLLVEVVGGVQRGAEGEREGAGEQRGDEQYAAPRGDAGPSGGLAAEQRGDPPRYRPGGRGHHTPRRGGGTGAGTRQRGAADGPGGERPVGHPGGGL